MSRKGFAGQTPLYARGKCLGGSSARNYLSYQIGPSDSYDLWAQLVGDDAYKFRNFQNSSQKPSLLHRLRMLGLPMQPRRMMHLASAVIRGLFL